MAERIKQMPTDGRRFGAYGMIVAPEGIIFVTKPGKGRGLEFPGGHGEPDDVSLEECFEREALEEVGVHITPEKMHLIDEARVLETHISGMFMAQIARLPKTLKKVGDGGEIVSILKMRDVRAMRSKIFPPHLRYLDMAFKILDTSQCERS